MSTNLRAIPIGNAMSVEVMGIDPLSAARGALVQLTEKVNPHHITSLSVNVMIVDPESHLPWEATAYAALMP